MDKRFSVHKLPCPLEIAFFAYLKYNKNSKIPKNNIIQGRKKRGGLMHRDIKKILFTAKIIRQRVKSLGKKISRDYRGRELVLIGVANGALIFLSDLMRAISVPVRIDLIRVKTYGQKTVSSGIVEISKDVEIEIAGKNVLVVEDIIDTGLTMDFIIRHLQKNNPASIGVCALLDKSAARKTNIKINYAGFPVTNEFVVGYGLDYAENYRHLPYIGVLKPEIYS